MSSRTNIYRTKSPQLRPYSKLSPNHDRSTLRSADRESLSSQTLQKTKAKAATKLTKKSSNKLSKKKLDETLQKTYEKYVGYIPTQASSAKNSKSIASDSERLKKKRKISTKPKRVHSKDENLNSRVSHLQKSIDSQERMLNDLQNKLTTEKSELSQISQQISGKKQRDTLGQEGETEYDHTNKSTPLISRYPTANDRFSLENEKEIKPKSILITRDTAQDKTPTRILSNERILQAYGADENYKQKWLYLKEHVNTIENHYELKFKQLTQEVARLTEENYRLRYRQGNTGAGKDEILEKLESIYKIRIAKAEEKCEQKDKELIDREKTFKLELEDVYRKIEHLQQESKYNRDANENVEELKRQLNLRENENGLLKKYYSEKLQMKAGELSKQKDEWSQQHKGLLEEIRELKRNVDQLSYENKKLSLSNSNQHNTKLVTSLRA